MRKPLLRGVVALVCALWASPLAAQQPKMLRVGLATIVPKGITPIASAFEARMAELGYERGRNFKFDFVQVRQMSEYQQTYRDIAARKVDLLIALGPEIALTSALAVAGALPVVMIAVDFDPVARGYVASLSRPGGNVTGLFFRQIELTAKRLELMKEMVPGIKAVTVFWDRNSADQWRAVNGAAAALGLRVLGIELRGAPYDYERAFAKAGPVYRGGLMVLGSPVFGLPNRKRLPEFAIRKGLPSIFINRAYAMAGGLISYGPSYRGMGKRAAEYVDRIARGAKPADLPVEQPTQFELVVNLKTAKALGLTIPQSILLRADEVIE